MNDRSTSTHVSTSSLRERILEATRGGATSALEVAASTGIDPGLVGVVLTDLIARGEIELLGGTACRAVDSSSRASQERTGCAQGSCGSCPLLG